MAGNSRIGRGFVYLRGNQWRASCDKRQFPHCWVSQKIMVDMDKILAQLWTAAATKGPEWLHSQVSSLLDDQACGLAAGGQELQRARRSRPPECSSLGSSPELCARRRSPAWDPPAKCPLASAGGAPRWNPRRRRSLVGGAVGRTCTPPPPARWHCRKPADSPPALRRGGSLCMGEVQPRPPGCYQTRPEAPV